MAHQLSSFFFSLFKKVNLSLIYSRTAETPKFISKLSLLFILALLMTLFSISVSCSQKREKIKADWEVKSDSIFSSLTSSPKLQEGYVIYKKYGCILCHGINGEKGVPNKNAQTGEEIPALTYVAEGYTMDELKQQILKGLENIPKKDSLGPNPPYRMPSWREIITNEELEALTLYLWSLMPEEKEEKW